MQTDTCPTNEETSSHLPPSSAVGLASVGDGYCERSDVVCYNTVCHVNAVYVILAHFAGVRPYTSPLRG